MTDQLTEALKMPEWPADRNAEWHRAQDIIRAAAQAHQECNQITDEQVHRLFAEWEGFYGKRGQAPRPTVLMARRMLEAAGRVREEQK